MPLIHAPHRWSKFVRSLRGPRRPPRFRFTAFCVALGLACLSEKHHKAAAPESAILPAPIERVRNLPKRQRDAALILIPAGETQIGDDSAPPDERPAFVYRSKAFLMDRTPVTVLQFRNFVEDTGYLTDAERFGSAGVLDEKQGAWIAEPGANWRQRSEERRVGKECRSRWSPYH